MLFQAATFVLATTASAVWGTQAQAQLVTSEAMHDQTVLASTTQIVPNAFGGGFTAYGSDGQSGTYTPNALGQGGTYYSNGGATQIVPNAFGQGFTAYGPNGHTSTFTPNAFGGGGTFYSR